jgi:hypothetical protein
VILLPLVFSAYFNLIMAGRRLAGMAAKEQTEQAADFDSDHPTACRLLSPLDQRDANQDRGGVASDADADLSDDDAAGFAASDDYYCHDDATCNHTGDLSVHCCFTNLPFCQLPSQQLHQASNSCHFVHHLRNGLFHQSGLGSVEISNNCSLVVG